VTNRYTLKNGNVLHLYQPPNSAQGPMKEGTCPGCANGLSGYVGHCACIRELVDGHDNDVVWGSYSTNYGHYACVEAIYLKVIEQLEFAPNDEAVHVWRTGTQRQLILFIQQAGDNGQHVVCSYDPLAGRDQRYKFHIYDEESS
jgi:hypothetical protein